MGMSYFFFFFSFSVLIYVCKIVSWSLKYNAHALMIVVSFCIHATTFVFIGMTIIANLTVNKFMYSFSFNVNLALVTTED